MNNNTQFKILIVDDSENNRELLTDLLSRENYLIYSVDNGRSALRKARSFNIDLILLDIMMPEMDGFEVCAELKKQKSTKDIPVIFLTSKDDFESVLKGFELGAVDYLVRPFQYMELIARVKTHVELKHTREELKIELEERKEVEEQLFKSREMYSSILSEISDAVFITDEFGRFTYICPNVQLIFGYSYTEVARFDNINKLFTSRPFDIPKLLEINEVRNIEVATNTKGGSIYYLLVNVKKVKINDGRLLYTCRDITQRKVAEENLKKNAANRSLLSEISYEFVNSSDFDKSIDKVFKQIGIHFNLSGVLFFKTIKQHSTLESYWSSSNKNITNLVFEYEQDLDDIRNRMLNNNIIDIESLKPLPETIEKIITQFELKTAIMLPVQVRQKIYGFIILSDTRQVKKWDEAELHFLKIISNILSSAYEQHLSDQNLRESESKLRAIFNNSPDSILITDQNGNNIDINEECCKQFGYNKDELIGKNISELQFNSDNPIPKKYLHDISEQREIIFESSFKTKDKNIVPVEIHSSSFDYAGSKAILNISRDITERKQLQKKIIKTIYETEERERTRFAQDLHDGLGALLSSINIYINLMKSGTLEKTEFDNILNYTKELVNEAIVSARYIANNLKPNLLKHYGLLESLKSFINTINASGTIKIHFKHDNYSAKLDKEIDLIVFRIINELINNTLKHAHAQNVIITIENIKEPNGLRLHYVDDGVGFDPELIKELSNKGMGLNNIIRRVESMNGTCEFISAADKGVSTKITLFV